MLAFEALGGPSFISTAKEGAMRSIVYAVVLGVLVILAMPVFAVAGCCDAPYAGCLARCGNKVTGGTSGGSPGTLKQECKNKCNVAFRSCVRDICRCGYYEKKCIARCTC